MPMPLPLTLLLRFRMFRRQIFRLRRFFFDIYAIRRCRRFRLSLCSFAMLL